ncbi:MAG: hypothetical protein EHM46_04555, partial [Bacteroidetes bacterium]
LNRRLNFPGHSISNITTNQYGAVWLVTDSRIMQVISTDQEPIIYEQEFGIQDNKILSFLIDREDNIWIGYSGGLQRLTGRKGLRNFYPGIINSYIHSVFQDDHNRIWIASDNGAFYFLDDQLVDFTPRTGYRNDRFTGTLLPGNNILLASNEGMVEVNGRNLEIVRRVSFNNMDNRLEDIFVTGKGEIFLLTGLEGAVYYLSDFNSEPVRFKNSFTTDLFNLVELNGRVIGGNNNGFVVFNGSEFELLQETGFRIWSLRKDENRLGVGADRGIGLVSDGEFDRVDLFPVDGEAVIRSINPARNRNYLWLGTNRGFSYFNSYTRETEFSIDSRDGLSGEEVTPGGLFLDRDDLLWVGTSHGISNFNIRAKSPASRAPVCYIEKMFLNGEPVRPESGKTLSHQENNLIFELSSLSFSEEGTVEYEYYLRGAGSAYNSYYRGNEYRAYYSNLPPGPYEFIYKARGNNHIWGYADKFDFVIRRAWYQTLAFRIILVISIISAISIYSLIRSRENRPEQETL